MLIVLVMKNSLSLILLKNSDMSDSISCLLLFSGEGVNLRTLDKTEISETVNFRSERLNIFISGCLPSAMLVSLYSRFVPKNIHCHHLVQY